VHEPLVGTKRARRAGLTTTVLQGKAEVTGPSVKTAQMTHIGSRAAARHDRIAEQGDDDGPSARGFALELFDDTGKRMRHMKRIARFADSRQPCFQPATPDNRHA
jgi:hypothetical protein